MDLSNTAIFKQLVGTYGYLLHLNNETVEMVVDHDGNMGLGTKQIQDAGLHIKSIGSNNKRNTDVASIILQNSSSFINNEDDTHRISFKDGAGTELAMYSYIVKIIKIYILNLII